MKKKFRVTHMDVDVEDYVRDYAEEYTRNFFAKTYCDGDLEALDEILEGDDEKAREMQDAMSEAQEEFENDEEKCREMILEMEATLPRELIVEVDIPDNLEEALEVYLQRNRENPYGIVEIDSAELEELEELLYEATRDVFEVTADWGMLNHTFKIEEIK